MVDGGVILAATRRAGAEAEAAARAGAQGLDEDAYRRGQGYRLDPADAERRAQAYLAQTGHTGTVTVTQPDTVSVEVRFSQPLVILGAFGVGPRSVSGDGTARAATGVSQPVSPL